MPELPEVETVKETLRNLVLHKRIKNVIVFYPNIIANPALKEFMEEIKGEVICDIQRRGKWLIFELNNYYLLSHLRMEGKYIIRKNKDEYEKHEHVIFSFDDNTELRYKDTRKFGRMHLVKKEDIKDYKIMQEIGYEPWDSNLTGQYLLEKYKNRKLPIKTALLDQSIIAGIGNIYADEILFLCHINPLKECGKINREEAMNIILYTKKILEKAIESGGTTIRSYESGEGVHGRFQQELLIHNKAHSLCPTCSAEIMKTTVGGRGTYYCPICQK